MEQSRGRAYDSTNPADPAGAASCQQPTFDGPRSRADRPDQGSGALQISEASCGDPPRPGGHPNPAFPIWIDCRPHRSEEHTSELQSRSDLVCRLLLEKKKND